MAQKPSETRDGSCVARGVCDSGRRVSYTLERAILAIGRDSALRRRYLRKRWQGSHSIEMPPSEHKPHSRAQELRVEQKTSNPFGPCVEPTE
jgi:hypothetical protein